ncbi:MAG: hypothetical protein VW268_11265 [Rhodospirillaceae bacterium]
MASAPADAPEAAAEPVTRQDQLVIHHDGRFLGPDLKPIDPAALDPARRVVLVLDPSLPLKAAMEARAKLPSANLIVAPLDARWRDALAKTGGPK